MKNSATSAAPCPFRCAVGAVPSSVISMTSGVRRTKASTDCMIDVVVEVSRCVACEKHCRVGVLRRDATFTGNKHDTDVPAHIAAHIVLVPSEEDLRRDVRDRARRAACRVPWQFVMSRWESFERWLLLLR